MTTLAILRETRQGRRVRHPAMGMVVAWCVAQVLWMITSILMVRAGQMPPLGDIYRWIWYFGAMALSSAVVCGLSWLLVALPIYWTWPRRSPFWTSLMVTFAGGISGGLVTVFIFPVWLALPWIAAIPVFIGAVSALEARRREEKFLREELIRTFDQSLAPGTR